MSAHRELATAMTGAARTVAKQRGISLGTLSYRVSGDCRFLAHVESGGNFTLRRYDRVMALLSQEGGRNA